MAEEEIRLNFHKFDDFLLQLQETKEIDTSRVDEKLDGYKTRFQDLLQNKDDSRARLNQARGTLKNLDLHNESERDRIQQQNQKALDSIHRMINGINEILNHIGSQTSLLSTNTTREKVLLVINNLEILFSNTKDGFSIQGLRQRDSVLVAQARKAKSELSSLQTTQAQDIAHWQQMLEMETSPPKKPLQVATLLHQTDAKLLDLELKTLKIEQQCINDS
jgi:hypothetical protein